MYGLSKDICIEHGLTENDAMLYYKISNKIRNRCYELVEKYMKDAMIIRVIHIHFGQFIVETDKGYYGIVVSKEMKCDVDMNIEEWYYGEEK